MTVLTYPTAAHLKILAKHTMHVLGSFDHFLGTCHDENGHWQQLVELGRGKMKTQHCLFCDDLFCESGQ